MVCSRSVLFHLFYLFWFHLSDCVCSRWLNRVRLLISCICYCCRVIFFHLFFRFFFVFTLLYFWRTFLSFLQFCCCLLFDWQKNWHTVFWCCQSCRLSASKKVILLLFCFLFLGRPSHFILAYENWCKFEIISMFGFDISISLCSLFSFVALFLFRNSIIEKKIYFCTFVFFGFASVKRAMD